GTPSAWCGESKKLRTAAVRRLLLCVRRGAVACGRCERRCVAAPVRCDKRGLERVCVGARASSVRDSFALDRRTRGSPNALWTCQVLERAEHHRVWWCT